MVHLVVDIFVLLVHICPAEHTRRLTDTGECACPPIVVSREVSMMWPIVHCAGLGFNFKFEFAGYLGILSTRVYTSHPHHGSKAEDNNRGHASR